MKKEEKKFLSLGIAIAIPATVELLSLKIQDEGIGAGLWPFGVSPPTAALYGLRALLWTLMALSSFRVHWSESPERHDALQLYAAALVAFFLWTVFYYHFHSVALSFFWLLFLVLLTLRLIWASEQSSPGTGKLQIPWAIYTTILALLHLRLLIPL